MKSKKTMIIDSEKLTVESVLVGQPNRKTVDEISMIIANSYKNRGIANG
ncbi:MAG: hypothetical protein H6626_02950 [Pseudobdellovibrionaceae bacterium]|nr:MAG: hypothetical protein H6626_02950 [Pseudobdellovibrionaceae bacterium]